jgi:CBS domain-containing protein
MKVEAILRAKGRTVETTLPTTRIAAAVSEMASRGIGSLVVSADGRRVDGVISEREIVRGLARYGPGLLNMTVEELMSQHAPRCSSGDTVAYLMKEMTLSRRRHVPVVDDGRLSGMVSIGDVVKSRLEELEQEVVLLRDAYIVRR